MSEGLLPELQLKSCQNFKTRDAFVFTWLSIKNQASLEYLSERNFKNRGKILHFLEYSYRLNHDTFKYVNCVKVTNVK